MTKNGFYHYSPLLFGYNDSALETMKSLVLQYLYQIVCFINYNVYC